MSEPVDGAARPALDVEAIKRHLERPRRVSVVRDDCLALISLAADLRAKVDGWIDAFARVEHERDTARAALAALADVKGERDFFRKMMVRSSEQVAASEARVKEAKGLLAEAAEQATHDEHCEAGLVQASACSCGVLAWSRRVRAFLATQPNPAPEEERDWQAVDPNVRRWIVNVLLHPMASGLMLYETIKSKQEYEARRQAARAAINLLMAGTGYALEVTPPSAPQERGMNEAKVETWMLSAAHRVIHGKQSHSEWVGARPGHLPEQACEWSAMAIADEFATKEQSGPAPPLRHAFVGHNDDGRDCAIAGCHRFADFRPCGKPESDPVHEKETI